VNGEALVIALLADARANILKLNDVGVRVTPEQADERARNWVMSLLGGYEVRALPPLSMTIKEWAKWDEGKARP